ncbi:ABC transporter permease [Plantactinospora sp. WMMC1484]|uniref:ABC transporter permease n=1 Tax=Plantactinospora sp. WMMC1484 TaxID=3404122 RepID=UPI003BF54799
MTPNTASGWRQLLAPRAAGVVYAFVALVVTLTVASDLQGRPSYLRSVNIANVLDQTALVGILAVFMTVVLITGNFDLSVASTAALSGTVALTLVDEHGAFVALVAALLSGAAVGTLNGVLVQKVGVNAFIVTLGTLTAVRGIVQAILEGQSITATNTVFLDFGTARATLPRPVAVAAGAALLVAGVAIALRRREGRFAPGAHLALGLAGVAVLALATAAPRLLTQTAPVWLLLVLAVLTSLVLRYTVVGRNLYAVGGNAEAARLSGIDVDRYRMGAFVLNGVVAGGVGVLYAGRFNSVDPTVLTGAELTVIAAAILGGTSLFGGSGYVAKSVVGALVLFTLSNGFNVLNIGANYQNVVQGGVLIAAASLYTVTALRRRSAPRDDDRPEPAPPVPVEPAEAIRI